MVAISESVDGILRFEHSKEVVEQYFPGGAVYYAEQGGSDFACE